MHRLVIAALVLSTAASVAVAQRYTSAGTRGTVTAYELDTRTVLEHKVCPRSGYTWDYAKFTRGERFVYRPLPREDFDMTMEQVERWKLDDYLKERSFEKLVFRTA